MFEKLKRIFCYHDKMEKMETEVLGATLGYDISATRLFRDRLVCACGKTAYSKNYIVHSDRKISPQFYHRNWPIDENGNRLEIYKGEL